jgi:hypothetical protein
MFGEGVMKAIFGTRVTSHQDVGRRWYPEVLKEASMAQRDHGKT